MEKRFILHPYRVLTRKLMKKLLLIIFTFLLVTPCTYTLAQDLINSRRSSFYTFIYRLSNTQAEELNENIWKANQSFMTELYDLYPTDSSYRKELPVGHYLFVSSEQGNLKTVLESENNVFLSLLNNHRDLVILLHDRHGQEVSTAEVRTDRGRKIPFDQSTRTYRLAKSSLRGCLRIHYGGHSSFFELSRRTNNTFFARTGRRIAGNVAIRHLISPLVYTTNSVRNLINGNTIYPPGFYYRTKRIFSPATKTYQGYISFNKPLYKTSDTVRLKAFLQTQRGRKYSKPVDVYLSGTAHRYEKKLFTLSPYENGAFHTFFALTDSLKLTLDRRYNVLLKTKNGKTIFSSSFSYEDYELKQNHFSARAENGPDGQPAFLFLKGTDSNEQPLFDIRVQIILKRGAVSDYFSRTVYVPDTLWQHTLNLKPDGETKITLPDSLLPPADLAYLAEIIFLNAENERTVKVLNLRHTSDPFPVKSELKNDSLVLTWLNGKKNQSVSLDIDQNKRTIKKIIDLPYREKINAHTRQYTIKTGERTSVLDVSKTQDQLQIVASRTTDSLFVTSLNPRKIPFRYFLFRNDRLVAEGWTESLSLARTASDGDDYSLSVQHIWAGVPKTNEYRIPLERNNLLISVTHPQLVYPGEKTTFGISVKDNRGKPVADADLTAWAITGKFREYAPPSVPSFEKPVKARKVYNEFNTAEQNTEGKLHLEYSYWRKTLGLDSISFYRFLYPDTGYYETRSPSATSEFAPFVVSNGQVEKVRIIYADGQPVYYSETGINEPYSFMLKPGKHTIELRTWNASFTLRNINIEPDRKLIFSVDRNHLPPDVRYKTEPVALAPDEVNRLSRYFVLMPAYPSALAPYVRQGKRFFLLANDRGYGSSSALAGPFLPGTMTYVPKEGDHLSLDYEPYYRYSFRNNMALLKEADIKSSIRSGSSWPWYCSPVFSDTVWTEQSIINFRKKHEYNVRRGFAPFPDLPGAGKNTGQLLIQSPPLNKEPAAVFMMSLDRPGQYYLLPALPSYQNFHSGHYKAVIVYRDQTYHQAEPIEVRSRGLNYYRLDSTRLHPEDSLSRHIMRLVNQWSNGQNYSVLQRKQELQSTGAIHHGISSADNPYSHLVEGRVTDESGEPLPGVNIVIRGTAIGCVSDINGNYSIRCPEDGILVFSFIGYVTEEERINNNHSVDVKLNPDVKQLSEVVVVGYGVQTRREMTGSVASITTGRLAGVTVRSPRYRHGDSLEIKIRGVSSVSGGAEPLVILDGKIVRMSEVNLSRITASEVLSGEAATAIYGSAAANGIILLTSQPGMGKEYLVQMGRAAIPALPPEVAGNELRKNFRDYAFWKPQLKTESDGTVSFEATFPDDITGWNMYVMGMSSKRSGQTRSTIQSFKLLSAQIALPHFLTEGDNATAIGKITAYNTGPITVGRHLKVNDQNVLSDTSTITNTSIDSIRLQAQGHDSVSVEYTVSMNRYHDGELRTIPVYRRGVMEANGSFVPLTSDTTLTLTFDDPTNPVRIYASADVIDELLNDINRLKNYPYECNEQSASRLRALLLERNIALFRRENFRGENAVQRMIRKLTGNQNADGSWSWWKTGTGDLWITLHVARVLLQAKKEGIGVAFDREALFGYITSTLGSAQPVMKLNALKFLIEHGQKAGVKDVTDSLAKRSRQSLHLKLTIQRLLQLSGETPDWTWINSVRTSTIKGNYYWGEEKNNVWDNDILNTLLVYEMMVHAGAAPDSLRKLQHYFLEKRSRTWRNTYESARILETILPVILKEKSTYTSPALRLSGGINKVIDKFPYEYTGPLARVEIEKTGGSPVYFSAWQEKWNDAPNRKEHVFDVKTEFAGYASNFLPAGKAVTLTVTLTVKHDAEYVLIDVPIPSGCSYSSKGQSRAAGEVHREYFYHKTSIFCPYLKKGTYTYNIELLPRYAGCYTLNPAVAECMYFPTLYGREGMKQVNIKK